MTTSIDWHNDALKDLHNDALMDKLHDLVRAERQLTAELLRVLIEVDRRLLYAERGYSSLFAYCVDVLNMSDASIGVRIHAARCCGRFPRLLHMLHDGRLHLAAILLLAPRLCDANFEQLTQMACNKSKRQLKQLLADLFPEPDVAPAIRKLPETKRQATSATSPAVGTERSVPGSSEPASPNPSNANEHSGPPVVDGAPALPHQAATTQSGPSAAPAGGPPARSPSTLSRPSTLEPLGNRRYKLQLTASQQLKDKLEQAGDLLHHRINRRDLPGLIEFALDRLIAEEHKRQHGATNRPRPPRQGTCQGRPTPTDGNEEAAGNPSKASSNNEPKPASRHIPNHIKREVYARDQGQCTFVSTDGRRCCERAGLQYHHEVPFAKGGQSSAGNVRLLCSVHNALLARRDYGPEKIEASIERSRQRREPGAVSATQTARSATASAQPGLPAGHAAVEHATHSPQQRQRPLFADLPLQSDRCGPMEARRGARRGHPATAGGLGP